MMLIIKKSKKLFFYLVIIFFTIPSCTVDTVVATITTDTNFLNKQHDITLVDTDIYTDVNATIQCADALEIIIKSKTNSNINKNSFDCEWSISDIINQKPIDYKKINLIYGNGLDDNAKKIIGYISKKSQCSKVKLGWYYDYNEAPKTIIVCHQTCDFILSTLNSSLRVEIGCKTQTAKLLDK